MRRVLLPCGSSESSLPPQTLVESCSAAAVPASAFAARLDSRPASNLRPAESPWMESSSPCSDSSKVSKWRPGMGSMYLEHHFDIGRAFAREQVHRDARVVPAQRQIEPAVAHAQAAHHQPVEE